MARVWKVGDDINTDEIITSKYYPRENLVELGQFALIEVYPKFANEKQKGDVLIAGNNFGCGSSREYAPIALKATGIRCVIAKSFARIFYRNAINIGLPILIGDIDAKEGDEIDADPESGKVRVNGREYMTKPLPGFIMKIISSNGIVEFLQAHDFEELK